MRHGPDLMLAKDGLAPRALRDIKAAQETGRFTVRDAELALVAAAGSILALGQLLHVQPERDAGAAADELTTELLRMFGMDPDEAAAICAQPLPDLEELLA